jgi:hypothetical protein
MKKLWLAMLFLAGGFAHEVRNPLNCHSISSRQLAGPRRPGRD